MDEMRLITYIEICNESEIRFLRAGDFEYQIEGEKAVEKFMNNLKEYALFDEHEQRYLDDLGLYEYNKEYDFADTLNLLDRIDIDVLKKHSTLIN